MSSYETSSSDSEGLHEKISSKVKGKNKQRPTVVVTPHGKDEGANLDWTFQVPEGATLADTNKEGDEFDWDALGDDDELELWIMRVPQGVTPKHLEELKLDAPSGSISLSAKMGTLTGQPTVYDIWSLGDNTEGIVGAEEVKNLTCLAPRHKKRGKLYPTASKIPTRHVVLSARPPSSTRDKSPESGEDMSWALRQNPPRPSYPIEMLKHRFVPFGSLGVTDVSEGGDNMNVDESLSSKPQKTKGTKYEEVKVKKRKVESVGSARKSKKSHATHT
ncbi:hypothetical protein BDY19DRAFT_989352 [Irpex rosettiformis]|uniref:Uncharacterized protein n=1 Tax=Irpex rosettiformis TaxID=378272 RepID=A0ACB8UHQ2_9APHY|nr:hypothetical protein BDY19DRAFT_989352 [Irpex rosettiformis]